MKADVSVVMSVYNGEKYLREAIDSILNQTFKNFEFIIIDDGSTDASKKIVQSYSDKRIILIEQKNEGLAIALNNAIKICKTSLIARMDSDDIAFPERLELQYNFLNSNAEYILVGSNAEIIDREGNYIYTSVLPRQWETIEKTLPDSSFFHSSVMYRKDAFYLAGGYFEEISRFNCFEDSILWVKMKPYGKMVNIEKALIKYRLVPNASTAKSGKDAILINRIFKEVVKDNSLSPKNAGLLQSLKLTINQSERERTYHLHIAKKFLFNNFQPVKARKNLCLALRIKIYEPMPYLLFMLTFLPHSFIRFIYNYKKPNPISKNSSDKNNAYE